MAGSDPDQLVLDDALFILYSRFNSGVDINTLDKNTKNDLFALLSKIKLPIALNAEQIRRCYTKLPDSLHDGVLEGIAATGAVESLEDTALDTVHGVILTLGKTSMPYVDIHDQTVDTNFSITIAAGQSRSLLVQHIARLASNAISLHIYDRYLFNGIRTGVTAFETLLNKTTAEIICHDGKGKACFKALQSYLAGKNISNPVKYALHLYQDMHDRYLIIEYPTHSYEIILSSGFEYLFSDRKEITCVFRRK